MRALESFRHDYELYREHEIESYKESVPREALLAVGDEAVERLRRMPDAAVSDLVLCDEVDRIIARRLKLPGYRTWRRRHMARLAEWQTPGHWGLDVERSLVQALLAARDGEQVLVAGVDDANVVLFAAALGCAVTAIGYSATVVNHIVASAEGAGIGRRLCGVVGDLDGVRLEAGLQVVVCSTGALARIDADARAVVIDALQRATLPGGTHFMRAVRDESAAGVDRPVFGELERWYASWQCTLEGDGRRTFVACKGR